ncbi:unnamed protein product [Closterium sp. Naga37s-1]|nr:unnamed protein product [Closterium sp. Naga37s-1]
MLACSHMWGGGSMGVEGGRMGVVGGGMGVEWGGMGVDWGGMGVECGGYGRGVVGGMGVECGVGRYGCAQGGAWCSSGEECRQRSLTALGSSRLLPATADAEGVFSDDPAINPGGGVGVLCRRAAAFFPALPPSAYACLPDAAIFLDRCLPL